MPGIIAFEDFELDELRFELRRAGEPVRVQPKVLRLLFYLAQHRQRSVSTQELLDALWPGESVTVASIKRAVGGARRALGEGPGSEVSIRTVRGHGYRFVRAADAPEPARAAAEPSSDFVGRERALAQLEACVLRAREGRGTFAVVSGEPGIGKSRLLQEFARRAAHSGGHVWQGRCTDQEGAPALWPFLQILRAAHAELGAESFQEAMGPGAPEIAGAMPELRGFLPQIAAAPEIDSTASRFRFFDSLLNCFERMAGRGRVCLILDDLQHADPLTFALLLFMGRQLDRSHVLMVASLRASAKRASAGPSPLCALLNLSTLNELELTGMSPDELALWLERRSGAPADANFVRRLHEQTAGNPLFVERLLQLPEALLAQPAAAEGLQRAIEQHVAALSDDTRRCLSVATVLGREFSAGVLAELLQLSAAQITLPLRAAVSAGLLRVHGSPDAYAFAHALIRDALYAQLAEDERARLHARAALALEAHSDGNELALAQIAEHALRAAPHHDPGRALSAARRAAEAALKRAAYEEAAALFERSVRMLEGGSFEPELQLELLIAQAEALAHAGDAQPARDALCRAAARARALEVPEVLVRAAIAFAQLPETGSVDTQRLALLEQALAGCAHEDPRKTCLEALRAKALVYSRDRAGCTRLARSALRGAENMSDLGLRAQTLIACWHGLAEPDGLPEREHIGEALARLGHEHGDCRALAWSALTRVACASELGDLAAVDAGIATLETIAERARDPLARWHSLTFRAMRCTLAAQLTAAEDWAERAYRYGVALGPIGARHVYCTQVAALRRLQGRSAEAEALVREVSLSHPAIAGWQAVLASLEAEQGQTEQPRKVLERLVEHDLAALRRDPFALSVIAAAADLCLLVGDASHARTIYDALHPYENRHGSISIGIGSHGPLAGHLGRLAMQLHEINLAERHFERAVAMAEAMPSPLFTSLNLLGYARLLLVARTRSGARAEAMIARATELGRTHDIPVVLRYAHMLGALARNGGARAAASKP